MKTLEGLQAVPIQDDNLHLAFIKGALDFLGINVSAAWLAGATGHAFIIHIEKGVCLSSMWSALSDAYANGEMTRLGNNVGYNLDYYHADNPVQRQEAWGRIRQAIDAGHPCYIYHNFCYQMIGGYEDAGIHFADGFPHANAGQGPISIIDQGEFDMGIIRPGQPAGDGATVREGMVFALGHPEAVPEYRGLAAYDRWTEAIQSGDAGGTWRSIRGWYDCRSLAVEFLSEAKQRTRPDAGDLFDEAAEHYRNVKDSLEPIAERCTANSLDVTEPGVRDETIENLHSARRGEEEGLKVLQKIAAAL